MKIRVIHESEQKTTVWSGGTTTELFLYPPEGSYKERNFTFRISTALCKDPVSDFTILKETRRYLMPLEGEVTLSHEDGRIVRLAPGEVDVFDGGQPTRSDGICRDFNLMLKNNTEGEIEYVSVKPDAGKKIPCGHAFLGIYVVRGSGQVLVKSRAYPLELHDFALMSEQEEDEAEVEAETEEEALLSSDCPEGLCAALVWVDKCWAQVCRNETIPESDRQK